MRLIYNHSLPRSVVDHNSNKVIEATPRQRFFWLQYKSTGMNHYN